MMHMKIYTPDKGYDPAPEIASTFKVLLGRTRSYDEDGLLLAELWKQVLSPNPNTYVLQDRGRFPYR